MGKSQAFILCPFDEEFTDIYKHLIKPGLEKAGYIVSRADKDLNQRNILLDIIEGIIKSDLIVAEITSTNPNVYYELGIAHGLNKKTLLLTQVIEQVPFDLRNYKVITYSTDFTKVDKLIKDLEEIGKKTINGDILYSNPVVDFGKEYITEKPSEAIPDIPNIDESLEEIGFLDFITEFFKLNETIQTKIISITDGLQYVTLSMNSANKELSSLDKSKPGFFIRAKDLLDGVAGDLIEFGKLMENDNPALKRAWDKMKDNIKGFFKLVVLKSEDDRNSAKQLRETMIILKNTLEKALEGSDVYINSMDTVSNLSREMKKSTSYVKVHYKQLIETLHIGVSVCDITVSKLDAML
ncbi:hypothetical protein KAU45_10445 [bacterium]|nr:hypothetical protein [bacterium]